jgi:intein/homing endonuclease
MVEEVFVTESLVWHLHIGGQVIRTTAEHPFYAHEKGWVNANQLAVGDWLLAENGHWLILDDLLDTGEYEAVYNCRVADHHTYFVGTEEWGFSVWAHNACSRTSGNNAASVVGRAKHQQFSDTMKNKGNLGETRLANGKRADGLKLNKDGSGGIVYELKPNNPRAIARGQKQVADYAAQLQQEKGGIWRGIVIKY